MPNPGRRLSAAYPASVTVRRRLDAELVRRGLLASRRQAVEAIAAGRVASVAARRGRIPLGRCRRVDPGRGGGSPVRVAWGREARRRAGTVRGAGPRAPGARRRRIDGWLHRLSAPGRRRPRRRGRRRTRATGLEPPRRRPRHRDGAHQRARLEADDLGGPVDLAVADLSFISLLTVAPALARCTARRRSRVAGQAAVRGRAGAHRQGRDRARPGGAPRRAA